MRKTVVSAVLGVLALGAGFGSFTLAGSAHTPQVTPTCSSLKVDLTNYNPQGDNTVTVLIDEKVVQEVTPFETTFQATYTFPGEVAHSYKVIVVAHDDPEGKEGWSVKYHDDTEPCVPATTTTPSATTPSATTPSATTPSATTPSATTPSATTNSSTATTTTVPTTTTTTATATTATTVTTTSPGSVVTTTTPAPTTTTPAVVSTTSPAAATTTRASTTTSAAAVVTRAAGTPALVTNLPRTGADGTSTILGISAVLLVLGSGAVLLTRRTTASARRG